MEWTVSQLAERAGISGRTLRHYHRIGLLEPRVGSNGYRYYGPDAVARLRRILQLRDTGMPLADIATVLDAPEVTTAEVEALRTHARQLVADREALDQRITAVERTLAMRDEGREPPGDVMLDGFNDRYEDEVVRRWGGDAYTAANRWWHGKSVDQQRDWKADAEDLLARWRTLWEQGLEPDSPEAQAHAAVHLAWFAAIPGTPTHEGDSERSAAMVRGVADLYETDPAFHEAFGGRGAAEFAASALRVRVRGLVDQF